MINHVRTLLQNMPSTWPSDEYVPPDFVPMAPPEAVSKVKRTLWGRTPVSQVCVRQIMQMLHATDLEEFVLCDDPRVTYLPFDDKHLGVDAGDLSAAMPNLMALLTEDDEKVLFGDITQAPNKTYYELWKEHDQLPYKLGGLILAVVACTERARK